MSSLFSGRNKLTPWIEKTVCQALLGASREDERRPKIVQVVHLSVRSVDDCVPRAMRISDGEKSVVAILSSATQNHLRSDFIPTRGCAVKIKEWKVSYTKRHLDAETEDLGRHFALTADGVCLYIQGEVEFVGGHGSGIAGDPVDVNESVQVRMIVQSLKGEEDNNLSRRLHRGHTSGGVLARNSIGKANPIAAAPAANVAVMLASVDADSKWRGIMREMNKRPTSQDPSSCPTRRKQKPWPENTSERHALMSNILRSFQGQSNSPLDGSSQRCQEDESGKPASRMEENSRRQVEVLTHDDVVGRYNSSEEEAMGIGDMLESEEEEEGATEGDEFNSSVARVAADTEKETKANYAAHAKGNERTNRSNGNGLQQSASQEVVQDPSVQRIDLPRHKNTGDADNARNGDDAQKDDDDAQKDDHDGEDEEFWFETQQDAQPPIQRRTSGPGRSTKRLRAASNDHHHRHLGSQPPEKKAFAIAARKPTIERLLASMGQKKNKEMPPLRDLSEFKKKGDMIRWWLRENKVEG